MTRTLLLLTACAACAACSGGDETRLLGTLERDRMELVAESQDPVVEIAVTEGDRVTAGQLLLRLDPAAYDARLTQARAEVAQAERRLAELVSGPRREEILAARARLAGVTARRDTEGSEFDRVAALVGQGLLPQSALDRQRALRDGAAADREAASEQLLALERGTRREVVEQAQAALDQATARAAQLAIERARLDVTAPRAGIVDALPYELGERAPRGVPVVVLLGDGVPYARVFVPQPIRSRVRQGTAARIRIDGLDRSWSGTVRFVSSDAAFTPYYALNERDRSRLSYLAEVVLDEPEAEALPAGVPVEVDLELEPATP